MTFFNRRLKNVTSLNHRLKTQINMFHIIKHGHTHPSQVKICMIEADPSFQGWKTSFIMEATLKAHRMQPTNQQHFSSLIDCRKYFFF